MTVVGRRARGAKRVSPLVAFAVALAGLLLSPIGGWIGGTSVATACSCTQIFSPQQQLEASTRVYTGLVTYVTNDNRYARLEVLRVYKGTMNRTVIVETSQGSDCAHPLKLGHSYLIYTDDAPPIILGCDRVPELSMAQAEIAAMGEGYPAREAPAVRARCSLGTGSASSDSTFALGGLAGLVTCIFARRRRRASAATLWPFGRRRTQAQSKTRTILTRLERDGSP